MLSSIILAQFFASGVKKDTSLNFVDSIFLLIV